MGLACLLVLGCMAVAIGIAYLRGEPNRWIAAHGETAEAYAQALLAGKQIPVPSTLTNQYIEISSNFVSFCTPSGPWNSSGMAYSLDGRKPENGLGGEPRVLSWKHIQGKWYAWLSD